MTLIASVALALTTWLCEHDATSTAVFDRGTFHFVLGSGTPRAQFAALVAPVDHGLASFSRVTFTARATRPMRINVDLRPAGTNNPPRWRRSVYIDDTSRTVTVPFADMHPIGGGAGPVPLATIGALLFVVDTNNTRPGTAADVIVSAVTFE
ncbi:MAG TPA: hypothetical protein VFA59_07410 [Vicinamibacterales bacterium]|nr:hypothetical protein [Vicinamibacterales bacterium]